MRKYKIYNTLLLLALFVLSMGCSDYLDEDPDERLKVNSLDKAEAALIGSYQNDRGVRFTHWSTDNVTLVQNVYDSYEFLEDLYSWNRSFRNQTHQDTPSAFWVAAYSSIANVNLVLESLNKLKVEGDEKAKVDALRGEALIMRSYCHFMLINLFAKHYDVSTASTDLGIPYMTELEKKLEVNYERGNVEDVYNKAEIDLLEGIALLEKDSKEVNKNKYRFTYPSAYLYASRFYNYRNKDQEDVKKTLAYANKSLEAFGGVSVMRHWVEYASDEFGPVDVDQQEVGMVQGSNSWILGNFVYQSTNSIADEELRTNPFNKSDKRFNITYRMKGDVFMPAAFFCQIYREVTQASDIFPIAEAIFNVAEASIRLKDFDKAKEMLEIIGQNSYDNNPDPIENPRGPYNPADLTTEKLKDYYEIADNDQEAWTKYLLFERRNTLFMRGFRWFDLKRYGIDVEHKLESGAIIKLSEIAPDKDYQIPNFAISSGMKPNK